MSDQEFAFEEEVLTVTYDDGTEEHFQILTHFQHPQTKRNYIFVIPNEGDENSEEQDVLAFRYVQGEGNNIQLEEIEDDKEWDMLEEFFNTFVEGNNS